MKSNLLKSSLATAALFATLLMGGCKKSDPEPTRTELLTRAAWIQTNMELRTGTSGTWNTDPSWANSSACDKDDQIVFRADHTLEVNEGASKCNPADPQVLYSGVWSFNADESIINVGAEPATILQLDANTLQVMSNYNIAGTVYYERDTYRH